MAIEKRTCVTMEQCGAGSVTYGVYRAQVHFTGDARKWSWYINQPTSFRVGSITLNTAIGVLRPEYEAMARLFATDEYPALED